MTEPPWDDLDPGVVGLVRALWDAGYQTCDSGDGRHKLTLDYDPDQMSPFTHVVVNLPTGDVERVATLLVGWAELHLPEEVQVDVHCFRLDGALRWVAYVHAPVGEGEPDPLFGWAP